MRKCVAILLALLISMSFGGMTFAKSLWDSSSIQKTFPLSTEGDKDEKGEEGKDQKMDDDKKGDDTGEDKHEGK